MNKRDNEREVLRELLDDGTLIESGGELYIRDTTRRKDRGETAPAEMLWGPLDGARLRIELDSTHVVAFIGMSYFVYKRIGGLDRLLFIGAALDNAGVDRILTE